MYNHVLVEHCFSKYSPVGEVKINSELQVFFLSDMQIDHIYMHIFIFAYN